MKKFSFVTVMCLFSIMFIAACSDDQEGLNDKNDHDMDEQHADEEEQHEEEGDHQHGENEHSRGDIEAEAAQAPESFNDSANNDLQVENTKNVTRIGEDDPVTFSVLTSQTIWPSTHAENQPGTVILAPVDSWQHSLASLTLVHHPNDGPLLYTDGEISDQVLQEIERLQPLGNAEGTEIIVIGDLPETELEKIADYEIDQISADDPAEFAAMVDQYYADIVGHLPESVIIGSLDDSAKHMSIVAGNWISHMDEPILYVGDHIPDSTIEALNKRDGNAHIYLLGSEQEISENIEEELSEYGSVQRISGESAVELSIAFASYEDERTGFGWGINEPGHGLTFASTATPELAIPGSPFAHLGKHAPMIWLDEGDLTQDIYQYLAKLKPAFENDPTEGPYNHGYLFGSTDIISFTVQGIIDEKMEIVSLSGDDHGEH